MLHTSSEAGAALGVALLHGCFLLPSADDHSRVRLQMLDGDNNSDYINGNYIDVCILHLPINPGFLTHTTPRSATQLVDVCQRHPQASVSVPDAPQMQPVWGETY